MLEKSVITRSGQSWKLVIAMLAFIVGSFAPLFSVSGVSWTGGTIIAMVGYVFGMVSIRCMSCSSHWIWEAAKDAGLYRRLFRHSVCPNCGQHFPAH